MKSDVQVARELLLADMQKIAAGNANLDASKQLNSHVKALCEIGKVELGFLKEAGLAAVRNSVVSNDKQLGDGRM
jgi:uncharacterized protein related to proFAR isomerase